ncbi:unnamed protein product [Brassica oleracea var. botrytis]
MEASLPALDRPRGAASNTGMELFCFFFFTAIHFYRGMGKIEAEIKHLVPRERCLSTIESIVYAMKEMGEDTESLDNMLDFLNPWLEIKEDRSVYSKVFVARAVGVCRSTRWSCVKCFSGAVLEASSMASPRRCCDLPLNLPPSSRLFGVDKQSVSTCSCLVSLLLVFVQASSLPQVATLGVKNLPLPGSRRRRPSRVSSISVVSGVSSSFGGLVGGGCTSQRRLGVSSASFSCDWIESVFWRHRSLAQRVRSVFHLVWLLIPTSIFVCALIVGESYEPKENPES